MTDGALAGLRVIDAATLAAGPLIATWLGEHGAEVIKVEQPDGGDPLRQWGAQRDGVGLPMLRQRGLFRREYAGPTLRPAPRHRAPGIAVTVST